MDGIQIQIQIRIVVPLKGKPVSPVYLELSAAKRKARPFVRPAQVIDLEMFPRVRRCKPVYIHPFLYIPLLRTFTLLILHYSHLLCIILLILYTSMEREIMREIIYVSNF